MSNELTESELRLLLDGCRSGTQAYRNLVPKLEALLMPRPAPLELGYFQHSQAIQASFCPVITDFIWTLPRSSHHLIPQNFKIFIEQDQQYIKKAQHE